MYRRIFLITSSTRPGVLSDKVIYNDNETGLPDFLSIRLEHIKESEIKGTMGNNLVYVSWQTAVEINTSHFELQRSDNGRDFHSIEIIMASGNSKNYSRYATTDSKYSFFYDKLYYRLKLVFLNGKVNFTEAITLNLSTVAAASIYDLTYNSNQQ